MQMYGIEFEVVYFLQVPCDARVIGHLCFIKKKNRENES